MDPVYDKWARHSPLLDRPATTHRDNWFQSSAQALRLNQHDQLDKDEWFSAACTGYFFPRAGVDLSKIGPFPHGGPSPHLEQQAQFSALIWINWSSNYAGGPTW